MRGREGRDSRADLSRWFVDTSRLLVFIARTFAIGAAADASPAEGLVGAAVGEWSNCKREENWAVEAVTSSASVAWDGLCEPSATAQSLSPLLLMRTAGPMFK